MQTLIAEAIGTMILVVLGDGVVANVVLTGTKGEKSGWIVIATGWGVAVAMAVYAVGRISGGHLNPAVTIALATIGSFPWAQVPGYVAAQMVGACAGAVIVWLTYWPHFSVTKDADAKLAVFATGPAIPHTAANFISEFVGTAMLTFGVLAIAGNAQMIVRPGDLDLSIVFSRGLQPLLVGILVLGIGLVARRADRIRHQPRARPRPSSRARPAADSRQARLRTGPTRGFRSSARSSVACPSAAIGSSGPGQRLRRRSASVCDAIGF